MLLGWRQWPCSSTRGVGIIPLGQVGHIQEAVPSRVNCLALNSLHFRDTLKDNSDLPLIILLGS